MSGLKQTSKIKAVTSACDPEETFALCESGNVFPLDSTAAEGSSDSCLKLIPLRGRAAATLQHGTYLAVPYAGLDSIVPFTA
jgi:hypothetical protein